MTPNNLIVPTYMVVLGGGSFLCAATGSIWGSLPPRGTNELFLTSEELLHPLRGNFGGGEGKIIPYVSVLVAYFVLIGYRVIQLELGKARC